MEYIKVGFLPFGAVLLRESSIHFLFLVLKAMRVVAPACAWPCLGFAPATVSHVEKKQNGCQYEIVLFLSCMPSSMSC